VLWITFDKDQIFHSPTKFANQCAGNKQGFFSHGNIFLEYQVRYDELILSLTFAFMVRTNEELESEMGEYLLKAVTNLPTHCLLLVSQQSCTWR
jgi:hypothetical protein